MSVFLITVFIVSEILFVALEYGLYNFKFSVTHLTERFKMSCFIFLLK